MSTFRTFEGIEARQRARTFAEVVAAEEFSDATAPSGTRLGGLQTP